MHAFSSKNEEKKNEPSFESFYSLVYIDSSKQIILFETKIKTTCPGVELTPRVYSSVTDNMRAIAMDSIFIARKIVFNEVEQSKFECLPLNGTDK